MIQWIAPKDIIKTFKTKLGNFRPNYGEKLDPKLAEKQLFRQFPDKSMIIWDIKTRNGKR